MYLPIHKAEQILGLMLEGMSIRSIERLTDVHRDTIMRVLVLAGERWEKLLTEKIQNLSVIDVQVDEIWGYVAKKESHKRPDQVSLATGDAYTYVAIERKTKLILTWHLGKKDVDLSRALHEQTPKSSEPGALVSTDHGWTQAVYRRRRIPVWSSRD